MKSSDRAGKILEMRGTDMVLADCRYRFWALFAKFWKAVPKEEKKERWKCLSSR